MALTWSVEKVENYKEVMTQKVEGQPDQWHPVTVALIWHSLGTGIGTITEANAAEVYARIALIEGLHGASLRNSEGEQPITMEDVRKHIGLSTNASFTDETRAKFLKRQTTPFLDDQARYFRLAQEKKKEEVAA